MNDNFHSLVHQPNPFKKSSSTKSFIPSVSTTERRLLRFFLLDLTATASSVVFLSPCCWSPFLSFSSFSSFSSLLSLSLSLPLELLSLLLLLLLLPLDVSVVRVCIFSLPSSFSSSAHRDAPTRRRERDSITTQRLQEMDSDRQTDKEKEIERVQRDKRLESIIQSHPPIEIRL